MPADHRVTGTMLRDVVVCERRAWHDVHGDQSRRDPVATFVQLLWAGGIAHERGVLQGLDDAVDLRGAPPSEREALTMRALDAGRATHVLGGEIASGDLLGRPDLISRIDGRWVAGDIKDGTPFMADGRRVKREYGVQVALYARVLGDLGVGAADTAFIIGSDGERVVFDLHAPWGGTTVAAMTGEAMGLARAIIAGSAETRGEASARCGLCHWRTVCRGELEAADDLTLVPELGRKLRADVEAVAPTRTALAELDLASVGIAGGRTTVPGLGAARLARFQDRARLQLIPGARAYATEPLGLARAALELHLDIEADPTRGGFVYLHGVWERRLAADGGEEVRFLHFFADDHDDEGAAFEGAWRLLTSDPTAVVYYYSPFERTAYRSLQRRHPDVCTADEVEAFFASDRTIDLYTDVVRPRTQWPLQSYGIKAIAKSLGFSWAAEDAGGASSIAWFDEYFRTRNPEVRARIVDYNRSDCIASAVVLDGLMQLPVGAPAWPPASGSLASGDASPGGLEGVGK